MRKIVIAGNWKMNKSVAESVKLATEVVAAANERGGVDNITVVLVRTT